MVAADSSPDAEAALVAALRQGSEAAFMELVERYHTALLRVAYGFVGSHAVAEEVVQETWLGVIKGINSFAGRSSLKTWIFRILANRARTRGAREARTIAFADLSRPDTDDEQPSIDSDRFYASGEPDAGWWRIHPANWAMIPEERILAAETRALIAKEIEALPPNQRLIVTLRDVEGWNADEVGRVLEISDGNQRVLLHRARAKLRRALDRYLAEE